MMSSRSSAVRLLDFNNGLSERLSTGMQEILSMKLKQMPSPFGRSKLPSGMAWSSKQLVTAIAAVIAMMLMASPAHAGFVTATFSNVNPGQVVTIHSPAGAETGWAGVYNFTNASGDLTGNLKTFCIDIGQDIFAGQTATFAVTSLANAPTPGSAMGVTRADLIRELWGRDYASIGSSSVNAAAFQISIWEIINESSSTLNIRNGSFWVNGVGTATLDQAQTWLSQLNGDASYRAPGLVALTNSKYQDYVVQASTVPAPPGLVLACTGAVCLLLPSAWRRRSFLSFGPAPRSMH